MLNFVSSIFSIYKVELCRMFCGLDELKNKEYLAPYLVGTKFCSLLIPLGTLPTKDSILEAPRFPDCTVSSSLCSRIGNGYFLLTQIHHGACSYSLNTVLFLFSYLFAFVCCTKFLDIFIWYVTMGQTKYHLSPKDRRSIKLQHYNSRQTLSGWGSLKQFKQMGNKIKEGKRRMSLAVIIYFMD